MRSILLMIQVQIEFQCNYLAVISKIFEILPLYNCIHFKLNLFKPSASFRYFFLNETNIEDYDEAAKNEQKQTEE